MSLCLPVCSESQGFSHKWVLGPLIIVDPSYSTDLTSASSTVWILCSPVRPCVSSIVHWTQRLLCLARKSSSELMDTMTCTTGGPGVDFWGLHTGRMLGRQMCVISGDTWNKFSKINLLWSISFSVLIFPSLLQQRKRCYLRLINKPLLKCRM